MGASVSDFTSVRILFARPQLSPTTDLHRLRFPLLPALACRCQRSDFFSNKFNKYCVLSADFPSTDSTLSTVTLRVFSGLNRQLHLNVDFLHIKCLRRGVFGQVCLTYGRKNQKPDTPATAQRFGLRALNTTPKCLRLSTHLWASLIKEKKKSDAATRSQQDKNLNILNFSTRVVTQMVSVTTWLTPRARHTGPGEVDGIDKTFCAVCGQNGQLRRITMQQKF